MTDHIHTVVSRSGAAGTARVVHLPNTAGTGPLCMPSLAHEATIYAQVWESPTCDTCRKADTP